MSYSTEQVVILLAVVPNIMAALIAVLNWRRIPFSLRPLIFLTLFSLFTELASRVLWFFKAPNLFIWPIYISIEFALIVWLYSIELANGFLKRIRWAVVLGVAALAALESLLRSAHPFMIDNAVRLLESILIIALVLHYYYCSLRDITTSYIWQQPLFWVYTGLLFFFAGNFFIYMFINFALFYSEKLNYRIWIAHAGLNSLLYCAYAYALWISRKR